MKPDGRKASSTLPATQRHAFCPRLPVQTCTFFFPAAFRTERQDAMLEHPRPLASPEPCLPPPHIRQDGRKTARRFEAAVRAGPDEPCSAAQTRRTLVLPLLPECRRGLFRRAECIPPSRRFPPLFLPLFSTHLFFSSPAKFFGRVLQEKETILKKTAVRFH